MSGSASGGAIPRLSLATDILTASVHQAGEDIEPPILDAADIVIDYGESRYTNPQGRSSTMIDFRDFSVVREGVCFEPIRDVLRGEFGVELRKRD